jgi:hypothetical protein
LRTPTSRGTTSQVGDWQHLSLKPLCRRHFDELLGARTFRRFGGKTYASSAQTGAFPLVWWETYAVSRRRDHFRAAEST